MRLTALPILLAVAAPADGWAQDAPLATSARLGVSVLPGASPWCGDTARLRVVAERGDAFAQTEFLALMQRVGTALVARDCPRAREAELTGSVAGRAEVVWRGRGRAEAGWEVRPEGAGVDLDESPAAAQPPVPSTPQASSPSAEAPRAVSPASDPVQIARPSRDGRSVTVVGRRVTIREARALDWHIVVDGRQVATEVADREPTITDARSLAGAGYVLIHFPNTGTACPGGGYGLLVVSATSARLHRELGTCSEHPPLVTLDAQGWRAVQQGPRAERETRYVLGERGVTRTEAARPVQAGGPVDGDLRVMLQGRTPDEIYLLRLADDALRSLMPPAQYQAVRDVAMNGLVTSFVRRGEWIAATACERYNCDANNAAIAFGPGNRAAVSVRRDGRVANHGSAPFDLRRFFDAGGR